MRRTIHKLFWVWEFDKEENWLNSMSAKGLQLCSVGFCKYTFDEGIPGEYVYRMEMLNHWPSHAESVQYIRFLEDTGVEHVDSLLRWVYFRKKADETGFDLYSDIDSRIRHINRILFMAGCLSGVNLFNGMNQAFMWSFQDSSASLTIMCLCLAVGLLLGYGFLRLFFKRRWLKREKILHE